MSFKILANSRFWKNRHLPAIQQDESTECGLACICMIACYWGFNVKLSEMRQRFSVSSKGATLLGLASIAQGCGLNFRALKVDLENLRDVRRPCIIHWGFNHFVVLKNVTRNAAVIHDPGFGARKVSIEEFGKYFTGVAIELTPSENFEVKAAEKDHSLRSLIGRVIGLRRSVFQVVALGIILQIISLLSPFYVQWVVDEALISADYDLIAILAAGFALIAILQAIILAVRSWTATTLSANFNFQWLSNVFAHLLRLPLSYFEKRSTGDIMSRFESVVAIQKTLTTQLVEAVVDGLLVVTTLIMMFLYNFELALISLTAAFLYSVVKFLTYFKLKNAYGESIVYAAKQQTHFLESIRGAQSIRLNGRESLRHSTWLNMTADQFNSELKISKISISQQSASDLIFGLERVLVVWAAGLAVLDSRFSIGMMYAFLSYKEQFSQRVGRIIDIIFELKMLSLHANRVSDIVMSAAEENNKDISELEMNMPEIEFKNISFRYSDEEALVISNLSLVIPSGQSIAITGASGSGKTTLVKILLGLLVPTSGEILVGGKGVAQIGIGNFRRMLGVVMQDDMLFAGSIADNISFFDPTIDREKVEESARLASVDSEIERMPMSYNTMIGDIGSGISGGQTQRILLARALYKKPKILVLDEATSNLDVENEIAVNLAVQKFNLTRIIIAHRPQTISMADRIVELRDGEIVNDNKNPRYSFQEHS